MARDETLTVVDEAVREALAELVGVATDDVDAAVLLAAVRETARRRENNSRHGGAIFTELLRRIDPDTGKPYTLRHLAELTGIPKDTISRWADPPEATS